MADSLGAKVVSIARRLTVPHCESQMKVQAMAEACGVPREAVTSPTFVLCNEYQGSQKIYHFDAYRVADRFVAEARRQNL